MKSTAFLLIGILLGWVLHSVYVINENSQAVTIADTQQVEPTDPLPQLGQIPTSVSVTPEDATQTIDSQLVQKPETSPESINPFKLALAQNDFPAALNFCLAFPPNSESRCYQQLLSYTEQSHFTEIEKKNFYREWLDSAPDDLEIGERLIALDIGDLAFVQAAERIALLKSYQTEETAFHRISKLVQTLARASIVRLTLQKEFSTLEPLLTTLINIEPDRPSWRYALAQTYEALEQYENAVDMLSYILFDTTYGDRATALYEELSAKINISAYAEIPLIKSRGQYFVRVLINDHYTAKLLLDTGASITTVKLSTLNQIGNLASRGTISLNTAGGKIDANVILLNAMSVGGHRLTNFRVAGVAMTGLDFDGLLGTDFLDKFRFVIHQKRNVLYLNPK